MESAPGRDERRRRWPPMAEDRSPTSSCSCRTTSAGVISAATAAARTAARRRRDLDRLAAEGLQFLSFYGQPSCTPGRAAAMTGRLPIRSGMTTVSFPGQGGGLPAAEWTVASVLKQAGYNTCQIGKWHLGEADYSMPTAHGFDEMHNTTLYHLNAYTYTDPAFNPDFPFDDAETMAMWGNVIGAVEGKAGEPWHEAEKLDSTKIPFIDEKSVRARRRLPRGPRHGRRARSSCTSTPPRCTSRTCRTRTSSGSRWRRASTPTRSSSWTTTSASSSTRSASSASSRTRSSSGRRTTARGRTSTPTAATRRSRARRAPTTRAAAACPAIAWWPGTIEAGRRNAEIVGSLDFMATFANLAGLDLPTEDRDGQPTIFDSCDQTALLTGSRAVDA